MAGTFGSLAKSLRTISAGLPNSVNELKKTVASTISTDLVRATQVDTGEAMSNWIVNSPNAVTIPRPAFVPSPKGKLIQIQYTRLWEHAVPSGQTRRNNEGPALDAAAAALVEVQPGADIHITNSVPHINYLDNGTPHIEPANFGTRATILAQGVISRAKLY
jgi:hypothetical protein